MLSSNPVVEGIKEAVDEAVDDGVVEMAMRFDATRCPEGAESVVTSLVMILLG